jgi:hypothetical protein
VRTEKRKGRNIGLALSGLGIFGAFLMAVKSPILSYFLFTISNIGWIIYIIKKDEMKEQLPLWFTYIFINIIGIINWS